MANSHQSLVKQLSEELGAAQRTILTLRVELAESEERAHIPKSFNGDEQPPPPYDSLHAQENERLKVTIAKLNGCIETLKFEAAEAAKDRAAVWKSRVEAEKDKVEAEDRAGSANFNLGLLKKALEEKEAEIQRLRQRNPGIDELKERLAETQDELSTVRSSVATPKPASKPKATKKHVAAKVGAVQAGGGKKRSLHATMTVTTLPRCAGNVDVFECGTGRAKRASATKARQNFVYGREEDTDDEEVLPT